MSEINFQYPVLPSGDDPTEKELEQMASFYFGNNNRFGTYILSHNMTAHGGVHIEGRADKLHALADGRIIAFRLPEDYQHDTSEQKLQYSNAFVLVQHEYISGKNESGQLQKLRFYSLYMHLMPQSELEKDPKNIPDWCARYFATVVTDELPIGLKVRGYDTSPTGNKKPDEVEFVPRGGIVKRDTTTKLPDNHWLCSTASKGYILCTYQNKKYVVLEKWLKPIDDGEYQIDHYKARDKNDLDKNEPKGAMLYDGINGKYIGMECNKTEIEIEYTRDKNWYKAVDRDVYLIAKDCDKTVLRTIADTINASAGVQNVDIPIKAGDFIGRPSKYQIEIATYYNTVHLEVFTDDPELKNVYNNSLGLNDRMIYEVARGKVLQLAKPCGFLTNGLRTKICNAEDDTYAQIGFEDVTCDIDDKTVALVDNYVRKKVYVNGGLVKKDIYTIAPEHFDAVNAKLNNCLPDGNAEVYYMESLGGNARKIGYGTQLSGKKYWVKKTEATGDKGTWINLTAHIGGYHEKLPGDQATDTTIEKRCASVKRKA